NICIERTSSGKRRLLSAAAHVKREAADGSTASTDCLPSEDTAYLLGATQACRTTPCTRPRRVADTAPIANVKSASSRNREQIQLAATNGLLPPSKSPPGPAGASTRPSYVPTWWLAPAVTSGSSDVARDGDMGIGTVDQDGSTMK